MSLGMQQSKSGGWQVSGTLVSGDVDKTVHAQATFPDAKYYTIQFSIDAGTQTLPSDPVPNGIFDCVAEITWSVEGNDVKRKISVGNGASISGAGEGVKVKVYDRTSTTIYGGSAGRPYKVSVQITPGTRPSEERPPTLVAEDATGASVIDVAGGSFTTINIPENSGVNSVNVVMNATGTNITPADAHIRLANSIVALKSFFPDSTGWYPIPPNATFVTLFNDFPALGPTISFTVTFGIEG